MQSNILAYMMKILFSSNSSVVEFWRLLEFQGPDILLEWHIKSLPEGSGENNYIFGLS
jgi:hypothetical protein